MKTYTTVSGDTWDQIARKELGNERFAQLILKENMEHVKTVIFSGGITLKIPDLPDEPLNNLPPWKRSDSE